MRSVLSLCMVLAFAVSACAQFNIVSAQIGSIEKQPAPVFSITSEQKCQCGPDCKCTPGACEAGQCDGPAVAVSDRKRQSQAMPAASGACSDGSCSSGSCATSAPASVSYSSYGGCSSGSCGSSNYYGSYSGDGGSCSSGACGSGVRGGLLSRVFRGRGCR